MKFRVLFKTPGTMQTSINSAIDQLEIQDEGEKHRLTMRMAELAEDYVQFGESVTLEFDTDTSTVRVKQCRKCLKQSDFAIQHWLKDNPDWSVVNYGLVREYKFSSFNAAIAFATRVGMYAERQDHHPVIEITGARVRVLWRTNDAGGITTRDFAGAGTCDAYFSQA